MKFTNSKTSHSRLDRGKYRECYRKCAPKSDNSKKSQIIASNAIISNTLTETQSAKPALPGYYFDPDTNRYYKIDKTHKPPQAPAPPPSKLTREEASLMRKQAPPVTVHPERKKIIINFKQSKSTSTKQQRFASSVSSINTFLSSSTEVIPSFVSRREIGLGNSIQFERNIRDIILQREFRNVARPNAINVVDAPSSVVQADIQLSSTRNKMVYAFNDGSMIIKSIQPRAQLSGNTGNNYLLGFKLDIATRVEAEITSVRWCPDGVPLLSITTFGSGGVDGCLEFYSDTTLTRVRSMAVRKSSVWTHEWSRDGKKLIMGASSKGMMLDTTSNKFTRLWTGKSDVFAVQFDSTEKLAFVGSRDGKIRTHDLRTDTTQRPEALPMSHNMPITCLKALKDDNYLIAESMDGVIQTWDRRVQRPVQVFHGLRNETTHLRFQVDEKENILVAGDHCGFINIWNLHSGKFLNSFGPFSPSVRNVACLEYRGSSLEDHDASCIVLSDKRFGLEAWTSGSE